MCKIGRASRHMNAIAYTDFAKSTHPAVLWAQNPCDTWSPDTTSPLPATTLNTNVTTTQCSKHITFQGHIEINEMLV